MNANQIGFIMAMVLFFTVIGFIVVDAAKQEPKKDNTQLKIACLESYSDYAYKQEYCHKLLTQPE